MCSTGGGQREAAELQQQQAYPRADPPSLTPTPGGVRDSYPSLELPSLPSLQRCVLLPQTSSTPRPVLGTASAASVRVLSSLF